MLSVLIPTYNYNIYPLAQEIYLQCKNENIAFEILCQDDASNSVLNKENEKINNLENCSFTVNSCTLYRGSNINTLAEKAKYPFLLILEADSYPATKVYIKNIIKNITPNTQAIFGGVIYPEIKPKKEYLLRWIYGNNREIKTLEYRLKNPNDYTFSWNFIIKKDIFSKTPFATDFPIYGYDDLIFSKNLKKEGVKIEHIYNPLIHINDETTEVFIKKCEKAARDIKKIVELGLIDSIDSKLTKNYHLLKKLYLDKVYFILFKIFKKLLLKNLASASPKLFFLDLYKLGIICDRD